MHQILATLSLFAAVVGMIAIIPQIITMLNTRASAGQSVLGWTFGIVTNTSLAFVNLLGYHAWVLAVGNLTSLIGCLIAVSLVLRFRRNTHPREPADVEELHTHEFVALRDAVLLEHHRRTGERAIAL